jgi:uncharacterized alkaline shock family protein YloU
MADESTPIGSIHVTPRAIASIAYHAALQSYGVVGLTSKNLMDGLTHVLVKDPTKGVEVHYDGQQINIDLYVIIEYGTRIKSVAASVSNTVRFHVEKILGTLDIRLRDSKEQFRNFGDVLDEVGGKWSSYNNIEKSAIANAFAGRLVLCLNI